MSGPISLQRDGEIMRVRLDRPEKLNSFSADLVDALLEAVRVAEAEEVRLLIFTGSGKGFSGGFDLSGLEEMTDEDLQHRFVRVEELLQAVYHAPFGTMALVHGPCYGAAADLVAACQWRVATPDARFRMPGLNFGIVLGTARLTSLVGPDAAHALLLRSKPFSATEALECGFVNSIAEQDKWREAEGDVLGAVLTLSWDNFKAMTLRTRLSDRDGDMTALLHSASHGSIKQRISEYLNSLGLEKTSKR